MHLPLEQIRDMYAGKYVLLGNLQQNESTGQICKADVLGVFTKKSDANAEARKYNKAEVEILNLTKQTTKPKAEDISEIEQHWNDIYTRRKDLLSRLANEGD